jgi:hypothetical protein
MKIIESGEAANNDKGAPPARTENRQRICAIACGGLPLRQSVKFRVFAENKRTVVIPGQPQRVGALRRPMTGSGLSPEFMTPVALFCSDAISC